MEWIPVADNLSQIKEAGLEVWLKEQEERQKLLEDLLRDYNEGRSMSLYCKVCARMPIDSINKATEKTKEKLADRELDKSDMKSKAKVFKSTISDLALEAHISLK
jgi:hypothetical protein